MEPAPSDLAAATLAKLELDIQELKRREAHYRDLFENASDAVYTHDENLVITACNGAALRLTGLARDEAVGTPLRSIVAPENFERLATAFRRLRTSEDRSVFEVDMIAADGRRIPVEISVRPMLDGGRVVGAQGTARDIADRKRAEAESAERATVAAFSADVGVALTTHPSIDVALMACAEALARYLDGSATSIWTFDPADGMLDLRGRGGELATGLPKHVRIPLGKHRVGRVAADRRPHLENLADESPRSDDSEWGSRAGMLTFAGYPLVVAGRLVGVMAMFSPKRCSETILSAMAAVADEIALGIDRAQAAEALRESEQRFRELFNRAPIGIYRMAPNGRVLDANPVFVSMLGYESYEELATTVTNLASLRAGDPSELDGGTDAEKEVIGREARWRRRDGWLVHVSENQRVIRSADGSVGCYEGTIEDISGRKRAEQELRETDVRYRLLFEQSPSPVWIYSLDTLEFLDVNDSALRLYGYSREEFLALTVLDVLPRDEWSDFLKTVATEQFTSRARRHIRKGGSLINVEVAGSEIRFAGRPARTVVIRDVTEQVRTQQLLRAAHDAAVESSRAKSQFLANMSHEIRTPMNGVIGMTGLLLDTELTQQQREYVDIVRGSSEALLAIINEILDFSKIEAGRLELAIAELNLRQCVEECFDVLSVDAESKQLDLVYCVDPDVPLVVEGDATRIRQVLVNLVANAVKFTTTGEVFVRVALSEVLDGEVLVRFDVRDTGIGIAEEQLGRLFEPFSQGDASATRRFGGTGLGLAISKRLTEAMGGRIWVMSELGVGSTFSFSVRLRPMAFAEEPLPTRAGWTALFVDRSAAIREAARVEAPRLGVNIVDHATPESALAWLAAGAVPHIALVEAGADAEPLVAALTDASVPVVLLASLRDEGNGERHLPTIKKPLKYSQVMDALENLLAGVEAETRTDDAASSTEPAATRKELRILLVEDNPINQKVATSLLDRLGYRHDLAENGLEAIEALRAAPYDLVLMDVQMPEMDGLEATERIRAEWPEERQPRIVAMTAGALAGDRERCLDAGMDDFVPKPVRLDDLRAALERVGEARQYSKKATDEMVPMLSRSIIENLRALGRPGEPDVYGALAGMFLEEARDRIAALEHAVANFDAASLESLSHGLRSSCATIGVERMARVCIELETAGRTSSFESARVALAKLFDEFEAVSPILAAELDHTSAAAGEPDTAV